MTIHSQEKLFRLVLSLFFVLAVNSPLNAQDLKNPLILDNEWAGYSIGDPYLLKHRGIYYLYCSTKDAETGIKCWSSKNLIDWKYEGLCATQPVTKGAYAPEVIYWNGTFFMYTSPAGNGHYVLSSTAPTGPFETITSNFGKTIDGSVFIDDDAQMYFYHASSQGILGCEMPSPSSFTGSIKLNTQMNFGWTEGPCVFKRNGKYYMIYTGNHVISKGYRIDYALNSTGPLSSFDPAENQNPVLLDALGLHTGLGHGSVFIGPDLDSYYLTYHNLVSAIGPFRRLNFDRIAWNGERMDVLGPTTYFQENPALPDGFDFFERTEPGREWLFPIGGDWTIREKGTMLQDNISQDGEWYLALLDSTVGQNYTAEFNLKELSRQDAAKVGIVFNYSNDDSFGYAAIDTETHKIEIGLYQDASQEIKDIIDIPGDLDFSKWHTIRLECFNGRYKFLLDGMFLHTSEMILEGGKIGYLSAANKAEFGFIAYSNKVGGSGTFDIYKPVPGYLAAVQYNSGGQGIGYFKNSQAEIAQKLIRIDEVKLADSPLGGYAIAALTPGEWFQYNINVEKSGLYNIEFIYRPENNDGQIQLVSDNGDISGTINLPSGDNNWMSYVHKDISLTAGYQTVKLKIISGKIDIYSMQIAYASNEAFDNQVNFDGSFGPGWKYYDGEWEIRDKNAVIDGFGKRCYGNEAWRDYTVEADILFTRSMNAGLIFRVNNPALGGAGNDPALGTDYLQGYFAGFNYGSVILGKHNYGWEPLASATRTFTMNTWYHMRVTVQENRILIFVDDMDVPAIDYSDPFPFLNGMAGIRSFNTGVRFDNFHVTSELLTGINQTREHGSEQPLVEIFPNPASRQMKINFHSRQIRTLSIFDINGRMVRTFTSSGNEIELDINQLSRGLYILRIEEGSISYNRKILLN